MGKLTKRLMCYFTQLRRFNRQTRVVGVGSNLLIHRASVFLRMAGEAAAAPAASGNHGIVIPPEH